jgi:hypothetical protein
MMKRRAFITLLAVADEVIDMKGPQFTVRFC